jgi:RNA polymerase sigma factor (sigma-70 family)
VPSTFFSPQSDVTAVNDLRTWSEVQLIAAARTGRQAPFGELCERHMKQVSYVTRRITRNREDAEDAAQDCFLSAFVHLKDFDGRSQFATWLTCIAINAALMKLRKNRGTREVPIDEPNPSFEPVAQREFRDDAPDPEESCFLVNGNGWWSQPSRGCGRELATLWSSSTYNNTQSGKPHRFWGFRPRQ